MEQKERKDLMLDIETLSTDRAKGLVFEVGYCLFDLDGEINEQTAEFTNDCSELSISVADSLLHGRKIDNSTQDWWMGRSATAKNRFIGGQLVCSTMNAAFEYIYDYIKKLNDRYDLYVWSKGIDFDFPMIESSFKTIGINDIPYSFWKKRDVRTFLEVAKLLGWKNPQKREDVDHSAMRDSIMQAKLVQMAWKYIRGNENEELRNENETRSYENEN